MKAPDDHDNNPPFEIVDFDDVYPDWPQSPQSAEGYEHDKIANGCEHDDNWKPITDSGAPGPETKSPSTIIAASFSWRDPATIPPRQFLYGRHYIRKTIGATIGAGGRAKTTLGLTDAVSMAYGRNLLTGETIMPLRPWYLNGEEDQDELDRRVAAICKLYNISETDCGGRLFVQSVRDKPIRLATVVKNAPTLNREALDQIEAEIRAKRIDVLMLDPFISFHSVNENANADMDLLLKEGLGAIASRTNCAGEVFHHPGKPKPGQAETTVEDARGASAIVWAVRSARVLNFMTLDEAQRLGIAEEIRRLHVRINNGKANMGPLGTASWFKLEVENLANGDEIACATPWKPADPFSGVTVTDMHKCRTLAQTGAYRSSSQSSDWIGYAIANVLNINVAHGAENKPEDIAKIKQILRTWLKTRCWRPRSAKTKTAKSASSSSQDRGNPSLKACPHPMKPTTTCRFENWRTSGAEWRATVALKGRFCATAPLAPPPYKGGQVERRSGLAARTVPIADSYDSPPA
jgi:hypothetical protein